MKKLALLLSLVFVAAVSVAVAEDAKKPADAKAAHAAKAAGLGKTHEVAAEVVSADLAKSTLTIKGDPDNKTVPVDAKAKASLKMVKPGEKVTLTCQDGPTGEHLKVLGIVPEKK